MLSTSYLLASLDFTMGVAHFRLFNLMYVLINDTLKNSCDTAPCNNEYKNHDPITQYSRHNASTDRGKPRHNECQDSRSPRRCLVLRNTISSTTDTHFLIVKFLIKSLEKTLYFSFTYLRPLDCGWTRKEPSQTSTINRQARR